MRNVSGFALTVDPEDRKNGAAVLIEQDVDAVRIHIPEHSRFNHPIRIRWTQSVTVEMNMGKNARVVIVEEIGTVAGFELRVARSHSVELHLEEGAEVEFVSIQTADATSSLTIRQRSHLADNAKISWRNVTLGAKELDHDLQSELAGENAVSEVDWMFYAKGEEKYRLTARNVFLGAHGGGEVTMKGVVEGKGHVRCNGMLEIGPKGNQTDTYLTQEVLMLDKTSKVDAIPGLEIKTNDVKASHSAMVSRVTEEDLFYFGSRGILEWEARRMFVEGFLADLASKITDTKTQEKIFTSIERKYAIGS